MAKPNPLHPIPHPPRQFLLGNLRSLSPATPAQDMARLARELGPIYWLDMPGIPLIVVSSAALADELCDTARFDKSTLGTLRRLRKLSHGLFTSDTHEPSWAKPHGILLPNFSQRAMRGYHPMMLDLAEQLIAKWDRLNPDDSIDVVRDMTALTLDTIGLCGFGYRFNSFYREGFHPFVDAMTRTLETVQKRRGVPLERWLMRKRLARMADDVAYMHAMVGDIVRERRASGLGLDDKPDLLSSMLAGIDKTSGEGLDDRQIRDECIEFLIAGHETTSGLLSFALHALLNHPDVLARARAEVDTAFGPDPEVPPGYAQVNRLVYVQQVLKEALRLHPTAPAIMLQARADTVIGGRYPIPRHSLIFLNTLALHRDPAVWGASPERFDPERFSRAAEAARPANAYKPFGNGQRACIGRQFAMHEATLVLGLILQRFELLDPTGYQLRVREALTLKPEGFTMRVQRRARPVAAAGPAVGRAADAAAPAAEALAPAVPAHGTPLLVLHGSNLGTAEDCARQLAEQGRALGFAVRLASLDDHVAQLPAAGVLLVVSASYNGAPPDNALQFVPWLAQAGQRLDGLHHAVFGCGNRDWAATYQAVPIVIDTHLARLGSQRALSRGEGDAREDLAGAFDAWCVALWPALGRLLGRALTLDASAAAPAAITVERLDATDASAPARALGARPLTVRINRELQQGAAGAVPDRSTRHIELDLPPGMHYRAGDHLALLPRNHEALVAQAMQRLGLAPGARVRLRSTARMPGHLPADEPVAVAQLLADCVELQAVATRRQIAVLAGLTRCPHTRAALQALGSGDDAARYRAEVLAPRRSLLDLLAQFPAIEATLADLLALWPPLAPRHYSIASSPLVDAGRCSLTVAVVDAPARSGAGRYRGVCSTMLQQAAPGSVLQGRVQPSAAGFHLPDDPATPIVMVGPGTGVAPFRGFVQQRQRLHAQGVALGEAWLFFGCRHPAQDFLYADELQAWAAQGLVRLELAFSRQGADKVYVQDRMRAQAAELGRLLRAGAVVYVCGDGARMEPAVRQCLLDIAQAQGEDAGWLARMVSERRYRLDVWAGG